MSFSQGMAMPVMEAEHCMRTTVNGVALDPDGCRKLVQLGAEMTVEGGGP